MSGFGIGFNEYLGSSFSGRRYPYAAGGYGAYAPGNCFGAGDVIDTYLQGNFSSQPAKIESLKKEQENNVGRALGIGTLLAAFGSAIYFLKKNPVKLQSLKSFFTKKNPANVVAVVPPTANATASAAAKANTNVILAILQGTVPAKVAGNGVVNAVNSNVTGAIVPVKVKTSKVAAATSKKVAEASKKVVKHVKKAAAPVIAKPKVVKTPNVSGLPVTVPELLREYKKLGVKPPIGTMYLTTEQRIAKYQQGLKRAQKAALNNYIQKLLAAAKAECIYVPKKLKGEKLKNYLLDQLKQYPIY